MRPQATYGRFGGPQQVGGFLSDSWVLAFKGLGEMALFKQREFKNLSDLCPELVALGRLRPEG